VTQPPLFADTFAEPVDLSTQVKRFPGTPDAPCHCQRDECAFPFCKPDDERKTA
jgi:hypothetical protein